VKYGYCRIAGIRQTEDILPQIALAGQTLLLQMPELGTDEEIDAYVRRLRETWMPASLAEIAEGQADHG